MIGLDTNVLVRYLVQDDPKQAALASDLVESLSSEAPGFVSHLVLAETVWVLESCFDAGTEKIAQMLETLLRVDGIVIEQPELVWRALRRMHQDRGDFSDTLITVLAGHAGCDVVYTFDRVAAKRSGMTLLK